MKKKFVMAMLLSVAVLGGLSSCGAKNVVSSSADVSSSTSAAKVYDGHYLFEILAQGTTHGSNGASYDGAMKNSVIVGYNAGDTVAASLKNCSWTFTGLDKGYITAVTVGSNTYDTSWAYAGYNDGTDWKYSNGVGTDKAADVVVYAFVLDGWK